MSTAESRTTDAAGLVSYSTAATLLGIPRQTLALLAERNGIVPKPMPSNAMAKGVDADDFAILRKAWKRVRVPVSR